MATIRSLEHDQETIREAFEVLIGFADEPLVPMLEGLRDSHIATLETLKAYIEVGKTLDLNLRAMADKLGAI